MKRKQHMLKNWYELLRNYGSIFCCCDVNVAKGLLNVFIDFKVYVAEFNIDVDCNDIVFGMVTNVGFNNDIVVFKEASEVGFKVVFDVIVNVDVNLLICDEWLVAFK